MNAKQRRIARRAIVWGYSPARLLFRGAEFNQPVFFGVNSVPGRSLVRCCVDASHPGLTLELVERVLARHAEMFP